MHIPKVWIFWFLDLWVLGFLGSLGFWISGLLGFRVFALLDLRDLCVWDCLEFSYLLASRSSIASCCYLRHGAVYLVLLITFLSCLLLCWTVCICLFFLWFGLVAAVACACYSWPGLNRRQCWHCTHDPAGTVDNVGIVLTTRQVDRSPHVWGIALWSWLSRHCTRRSSLILSRIVATAGIKIGSVIMTRQER